MSCTGIKSCVTYHPTGVLNTQPVSILVNTDQCMGCGQCLDYCPHEAIHVPSSLAIAEDACCIQCSDPTHRLPALAGLPVTNKNSE
jgi:NAD-dependent dihydropyrimidine dehydrogenase PreA subunit